MAIEGVLLASSPSLLQQHHRKVQLRYPIAQSAADGIDTTAVSVASGDTGVSLPQKKVHTAVSPEPHHFRCCAKTEQTSQTVP